MPLVDSSQAQRRIGLLERQLKDAVEVSGGAGEYLPTYLPTYPAGRSAPILTRLAPLSVSPTCSCGFPRKRVGLASSLLLQRLLLAGQPGQRHGLLPTRQAAYLPYGGSLAYSKHWLINRLNWLA
jgi:hypothetical protein